MRMKSDADLRCIPVIMVSASDDLQNVVRCIELGAEDYLPKPFNPVLLKARVNASLQKKRLHDQETLLRTQLQESNERLEERVRAQVREITSAQSATIFAMSRLAESRDPQSGGHLERLREYAKTLARELAKLPRYWQVIDEAYVDAIYAATPLLDIGKVGIPDAVLIKAGRLDPAEWEVMKAHALIGGDTLRVVDREHPGNIFIRMGIEIVEGHHEKWDGSGYPHGMTGESIPLAARIVALADVYDSLTAQRGHKRGFSHDDAKQIIVGGADRHFDPDVVQAFLAAEAEFVRIRRRFYDLEPRVNTLPEGA
jgi:putative two-component system response regulator